MDLDSLKLLSLEIHILSMQLKRNLQSLGFKYDDDKKAFVRAENGDISDMVVLSGPEDQHMLIVAKEEEENGMGCEPDKHNHPVTEMVKSDLIVLKDGKDNSNTSSMSIGFQVEKQGDTSEKLKIKWELYEHHVSEKELNSRPGNNFQQINNVSEANLQYKTLKNQLSNPKTPSHVMKSSTVTYTTWGDRVTNSCSKIEIFSLAHKVFDESPEPKCVEKSVYANSFNVHFAGYAHKPPKPPDYTNHNSQRNSCIDNITKLTSHTPISRFTNTNADATYVVVELNWFHMIAGLFDITEVKIKGKLNGPSVTEVELKSQIGNSFQHITTNEIFCCAYNVFDQSPEPFPSGHTFWFRKPPKPPDYICISISQANAYSPTSDNTHSCTPNSLRSSKFLLYVPFNNHNHPVSSHKKPTPNRTLQETYNTQLKIIKPCSNKFEAPDWNEQNTAKRELVIAKGIRAWDMRCCSKLSKAYPELELAVWVQSGHGEDVVLFLDESKDMPNKVHNNDIIINMVRHVVLSCSSKVYTSSKAYLLHHKALNFMLIGLLGPRKSVSFVALLVV